MANNDSTTSICFVTFYESTDNSTTGTWTVNTNSTFYYTASSNCTTGGYYTPRTLTPRDGNAFYRSAESTERREQRKLSEHAHKRARRLLERFLNPQQRDDLNRFGWFTVRVKRQLYRVHSHTLVANVDVLTEEGTVKHRLCCHCEGVPIGDALLAQKLLLETNESEFLSRANVHPAVAA